MKRVTYKLHFQLNIGMYLTVLQHLALALGNTAMHNARSRCC